MDSWKSLNLHLENLLPGILTLVMIAHLLPESVLSDPMENGILKNELMRGGVFVSVAYMLGVVAVAFCRILDPLSAKRPRYWALRLLAIDKTEIDKARQNEKPIDSVNRHYRERIREALSIAGTEVKAEIAKRRERLHLLRAALVPAVLFPWVFPLDGLLKIALTIANAIVILFLYAYLEVAVYDETCLSKIEESKQISQTAQSGSRGP
jgi:hypothetical protein